MAKPRRLFFWLVVAGVLMLFGFWVFSPHEAKYDGKPVSYWFMEYCRSGRSMGGRNQWRHSEAAAALKKIGTNAGPYLIEQSFTPQPDSRGWSNVCRILNALPPSWPTPHPVPSFVKTDEAASALKEVKLPAAMLVPMIQPHLQSTNRMEHRQSLFLLGTVGEGAEQAVPYLVAALQDPDPWARALTIQSLNWIGPKAQAAVPALMDAMEKNTGTNAGIARAAAIALGEIGTSAAPAIPLVRKMFEQGTNSNYGDMLAAALFRIDPTQKDALDFLIDGVKNRQPPNQRGGFVYALGEIGPSAKAAVPALLEELRRSTNYPVLVQIPQALTNIGVAPQKFLPMMKQSLGSPDPTIRAYGAARVLEIDPWDHEAHKVLMELIPVHDGWATFAIFTLGNTGPPAAEALPLLREVVKDEAHPAFHAMALQAIQQIDKPKEKR